MVSLTIVGCLVPYNDPELLNGSGSTDANASPFVIAVKNAGISVVPSIMNVSISTKLCILEAQLLISTGRHPYRRAQCG